MVKLILTDTTLMQWLGTYQDMVVYCWKWGSFSESILFFTIGSLSETAFCNRGSLGESKMWRIKRGSFRDRGFENGSQCGHTYPSHIFREYSPPPQFLQVNLQESMLILGKKTDATYYSSPTILVKFFTRGILAIISRNCTAVCLSPPHAMYMYSLTPACPGFFSVGGFEYLLGLSG